MGTQLPDFDSLWNYNRPAETEAGFRELLPTARASGDIPYLAELLTQIARTQGLQGAFEAAHATLDQAQALLLDVSPTDAASKGLTSVGVAPVGVAPSGDPPTPNPRPTIRLLLERGRVFNSSGRPDRARPLFLAAWELAVQSGEDFHAADAAHMMGIVEPPAEQLTWSLRALELAERSSDPRTASWRGSLYNNIGWTYHDLGRFEQALEYFRRSLAWQREQGQPREARIAVWTVGRALRSLGRYDEALTLQRNNLRDIAETDEPDGYIQEELGECLLALGREVEALPHFIRAYTVLSQDQLLQANEPERLARLHRLAGLRARPQPRPPGCPPASARHT